MSNQLVVTVLAVDVISGYKKAILLVLMWFQYDKVLFWNDKNVNSVSVSLPVPPSKWSLAY